MAKINFPSDLKKIPEIYRTEAKRLLPDKNYVGFSVTQGNAYRKKNWSINKFINLANKIEEKNKKRNKHKKINKKNTKKREVMAALGETCVKCEHCAETTRIQTDLPDPIWMYMLKRDANLSDEHRKLLHRWESESKVKTSEELVVRLLKLDRPDQLVARNLVDHNSNSRNYFTGEDSTFDLYIPGENEPIRVTRSVLNLNSSRGQDQESTRAPSTAPSAPSGDGEGSQGSSPKPTIPGFLSLSQTFMQAKGCGDPECDKPECDEDHDEDEEFFECSEDEEFDQGNFDDDGMPLVDEQSQETLLPIDPEKTYEEEESVWLMAFGATYREVRRNLQATRTGRDQKVVKHKKGSEVKKREFKVKKKFFQPGSRPRGPPNPTKKTCLLYTSPSPRD